LARGLIPSYNLRRRASQSLPARRGGPRMSSHALRLLALTALLAAPVICIGPAAGRDDEAPEVDVQLVEGELYGSTVTNSIGMKFVLIPKGKFSMGAAKGDGAAREHEKPLHEVEITKDYYLGVYEVTQKQYKQVMGSNPSDFSRNGPQSAKVKD